MAVSITETVLLPRLATYSCLPSALSASALGEEPTEMSVGSYARLASIHLYVSVLITDTVPLPVLATYSRLPSALTASALGEEPAAISVEK